MHSPAPSLYNFFLPALLFPILVSFHQCSIRIHSTAIHTVCYFSPSTSFSLLSIIPPMLHSHSFDCHTHCIIFFSQHFVFPCQYHSTNSPYSFIHLPPTLYSFLSQFFFSPASIIPPILHTHSFIYFRRYVSLATIATLNNAPKNDFWFLHLINLQKLFILPRWCDQHALPKLYYFLTKTQVIPLDRTGVLISTTEKA